MYNSYNQNAIVPDKYNEFQYAYIMAVTAVEYKL